MWLAAVSPGGRRHRKAGEDGDGWTTPPAIIRSMLDILSSMTCILPWMPRGGSSLVAEVVVVGPALEVVGRASGTMVTLSATVMSWGSTLAPEAPSMLCDVFRRNFHVLACRELGEGGARPIRGLGTRRWRGEGEPGLTEPPSSAVLGRPTFSLNLLTTFFSITTLWKGWRAGGPPGWG